MDSKYPDQRIKKAEKLRRQHGRFWSYFLEPDYCGSAELFLEVANETPGLDDRGILYNEAATTFLMKGGEYGFYRAAEVYKELMGLYRKENNESKVVEYGIMYGNSLGSSERYMLAGQAFSDVAAICEKRSPADAIKYYGESIRLYEMDGSCPFHTKKARERCLMLQIQENKLSDAIESLGGLDIRYARLCRQILCILCQTSFDDDLDDPAEHRLVMTLVNGTKDESTDALESFASNNFLPDYAQLVFKRAVENYKPENDIC